MIRKLTHIILSALIAASCVTPNSIDVIDNQGWVVFGLTGTGKAPVIFIYLTGNQFVYHYSADITFTDIESGNSYKLQSSVDDPEFQTSREFPFTKDVLGHIVYYTNDEVSPEAGRSYRIDIDLGEEEGSAVVTMPQPHDFVDVELDQNRNGVAKLKMTLPLPDSYELYKWEVMIDQYVQVNEPSAWDPVSGEPVSFYTVPQYLRMVITPENYITPERLTENQLFTYNLSENLPDYQYTDENYQLNVRLRRYGTELAEYFQSVYGQSDAWVTDPFTEPIFIKSNLEGLLGVIGTYAYSDDLILEYQR